MLVKYHPYKTFWPDDVAFLSVDLKTMTSFINKLINKSEATRLDNHIVFEILQNEKVTYIFISDNEVHFHRKIKPGRAT